MISPIIAATTSNPVASIQQNAEAQGVLNTNTATAKVKEEARQVRESVVQKDEAVFYQPHYDAKEESKNKYSNIYVKKKKKQSEDDSSEEAPQRINIDLKI